MTFLTGLTIGAIAGALAVVIGIVVFVKGLCAGGVK